MRDFIEIALLVALIQAVLLFVVLFHAIRVGWLPGVRMSCSAWFPARKNRKDKSPIAAEASRMVRQAAHHAYGVKGSLKVAPTDTTSGAVMSVVVPVTALQTLTATHLAKIAVMSLVPSPTGNASVTFSFANDHWQAEFAVTAKGTEPPFGLRIDRGTNRSVLREFNQQKLFPAHV